MSANRRRTLKIQGSCDRLAVGNEYYPSAYRRLRNGDAILVEVELEPTNPHDPSAVMVTIDGECAGYLASGPASKYHSVISRANALGYALSCSATVEEVGGLVVRLHLPWPEELSRWLDLPADQREHQYFTVAPPRVETWLKRLSDYHDNLTAFLGGQSTVTVTVDYTVEVTTSGKYKGDNLIRASVGGVTIGLLPAQYRAQNEVLFAAVESGERHGEAIISRFDERIGVKVLVENPA